MLDNIPQELEGLNKTELTIVTAYLKEHFEQTFIPFGRTTLKALEVALPGISGYIHKPTFKYTGILRLTQAGRDKALALCASKNIKVA